jgi:mannose-6-phosphate isomerase-like protein (cupin superfamily)
MAKIILEPNEIFEHFHSIESTTYLISGKAKYIGPTFEKILQINEIIETPANTSHKIQNIGNVECILGCQHGGVQPKE